MSDVAEKAGVSRQLVSMVLRGVDGPSEASRKLVLDTARALDFRPNSSARLLRQKRTRLIGLMIAAANVFELRVAERLLERAADLGFHVIVAPTSERRTTDVVISELLEQRVEAIACYNPDPSSEILQKALATLPVAWLGERASDPRADVIRTDDDTGMRLLVEHLVGLGHREIAYAGGLQAIVGLDRREAYRQAMRSAGLSAFVDVVEVGFGDEDGADAARRLLARDRLPTAVICSSDHCAAGLRAVFALAGVSVPGDVSVTGYDDSDVARLSFNLLTTVRQDVELTVEATLDSLLRRIEDGGLEPQEIPTLATLVVRESTGPARQRA
jgi:DNA-binding LacI/PurR family transcriptional regulator